MAQKLLSRVESNISDAETPIDTVVDETQAYLLTDRRLLSIKWTDDNEEDYKVVSTYLDSITSVGYQYSDGEEYDEDKLAIGALLGFLAIGCLALFTTTGEPVAPLSLLAFFASGILAAVFVFEGLKTIPSTTTITIYSNENEHSVTLKVEGDQSEFADKIERVISTVHDPPGKVKRKVG